MNSYRTLATFLLSAASCLLAQDGPSHIIITHRAYPEKRQSLRAGDKAAVQRLNHLRDEGNILGFQILASSLIDDEGWDTTAIVQLAPRALELWKHVDQFNSPDASFTSATPADLIESASTIDTPSTDGVYLVIPYEFADPVQYQAYAKGSVVPQVNGWMREGVLLGYQLFMARFPAGRSWNALLVLHYRDWIALGQRNAVIAKVYAQLASRPDWKSWDEQAVRREKAAVIAEAIASR